MLNTTGCLAQLKVTCHEVMPSAIVTPAVSIAGAMAFCFIQAVEQGQASTYNVLLRALRYAIKNGPQHFTQTPQLYASNKLDFNRPLMI